MTGRNPNYGGHDPGPYDWWIPRFPRKAPSSFVTGAQSVDPVLPSIPKAKLKDTGNDTLIVMVLDRSGSMVSIRKDMESGLNLFVKEQKEIEGRAFCYFVQFDTMDDCEVIYDYADIKAVGDIKLEPRGGTPLLDCLGKTLTKVRSDVAAWPFEARPSKVAFIIITDGEENSSHHYRLSSIKTYIEEAQADGWQFTYLGANQDAFAEAGGLGVGQANTMGYAANSAGVTASTGSLTSSVTAYRTGAPTISYTQEEQQEAQTPSPRPKTKSKS